MCRFIESIRLENGVFELLDYHQYRIGKAFRICFPGSNVVNLQHFLSGLTVPQSGLYKCRIVFDNQVNVCDFQPYIKKQISSLLLVDVDIPTTEFKSANRAKIDAAFNKRGKCDDVLLVRDGYITDASYSNVAFYDGNQWFTPRIPLIYGIRRAKLLNEGIIKEADITVGDLSRYSKICLFNAMVRFTETELSTEFIYY